MENETTHTPYVIAIAGGTGSGKTYIAKKLGEVAPDQILTISHDNYYHDRRDVPEELRKELNYDEPAALDNKLFLEHIKELKKEHSIDIPQYDFKTHTRKSDVRNVQPKSVVIVEGILLLADEALVEQFDLIIFIDVKSDIRLARRLQRDVGERDRSYESSLNQYLVSAGPMHDKYVEPGKEHADIIINNNGSMEDLEDSIATIQSRIKDILDID